MTSKAITAVKRTGSTAPNRMKRILFLIMIGCGGGLLADNTPVTIPATPAVAAAAPATGAAGRYLFIVETSKAMKREMPATIQSVQDLLTSGLEGQLRPGDTVGMW